MSASRQTSPLPGHGPVGPCPLWWSARRGLLGSPIVLAPVAFVLVGLLADLFLSGLPADIVVTGDVLGGHPDPSDRHGLGCIFRRDRSGMTSAHVVLDGLRRQCRVRLLVSRCTKRVQAGTYPDLVQELVPISLRVHLPRRTNHHRRLGCFTHVQAPFHVETGYRVPVTESAAGSPPTWYRPPCGRLSPSV
jgi:hypothetical protein